MSDSDSAAGHDSVKRPSKLANKPANEKRSLAGVDGCGSAAVSVVGPAPDEDADEDIRTALRVRVVRDLSDVDRDSWNGLNHGGSPFLEWGFLRALELSGSLGEGSGWHAFYLLADIPAGATGSATLVAAVPTFVKTHSYGEYIFDWAWAGAAERGGIAYYPKLVIAAPMTPVSGPRVLLEPGMPEDAAEKVTEALVGVVREIAEETGCSSIHWLFTTAQEQKRLARLGFAPRASYQFHWRNRGYADFEAFLATLKSRKRKQLRKERRRAQAQIDGLDFVPGGELTALQLDTLDSLYRFNTQCHGGMDYLRPGFFHRLAELAPERVLFAQARRGQQIAGGALFLQTERALYGRYWGCAEDVEFLHFETAYYAGIERAIACGLELFEAGAQGTHKLVRGFEPSATYSAHWIADSRLNDAVRQFLEIEEQEVAQRMAMFAERLPYRQDDTCKLASQG